MYIYNDEDNVPMSNIDDNGHNPTVYTSYAEMKHDREQETIKPGCWNCSEYDGGHCMKYWNNLDPAYYIPDRDDKEPNDICDDYHFDGIDWGDI